MIFFIFFLDLNLKMKSKSGMGAMAMAAAPISSKRGSGPEGPFQIENLIVQDWLNLR